MARPRTEDTSKLATSHGAKHKRLRTRRGSASQHACVDGCGKQAQDWSQRYGTDGMDAYDYDPRCRSCHLKYDYTDERRQLMSDINKGQDYCRTWIGRKHSEETKAKMSANNRWRKQPDDDEEPEE